MHKPFDSAILLQIYPEDAQRYVTTESPRVEKDQKQMPNTKWYSHTQTTR